MSFATYKRIVSDGDTVIIYLSISSVYALSVKSGKVFQTKYGALKHDDVIGTRYGDVLNCSRGWAYVLQPTPELWTLTLPHRTQILYAPDISVITLQLELKPGSVVCEAGTGSGSLSHAILRTIAPNGHLFTFDFHEQRVEKAKEEFDEHGLSELVTLGHRDVVSTGFGLDGVADAVFLDLPLPWNVVPSAVTALKPSVPCCSENPRMSFQDTTSTPTGLTAEEQYHVTELRRQLQAEYLYFSLSRLSPRDSFIVLDELYFDLTINEQDQYKRGERAEKIELQNLFLPPSTNLNNRVLVVSKTRFEETSTSKNLAFDRGQQEKNMEEFGTLTLKKLAFDWGQKDDYMRKFEIVIFVELGHIPNSFQELIEAAAVLTNPPIPLPDLLAKMKNKVLLLLNGYDDVRHRQIKDLDCVLRGEMFPDMTVIVSSRTVPTQTINETDFWSCLITIESITGRQGEDILSKWRKYFTTVKRATGNFSGTTSSKAEIKRFHHQLTKEEQGYMTKIQCSLQANYRNLRLSGLPWHTEDPVEILPMDELYVDLTMNRQDNYRRGNTMDNIEIQEIIQPWSTEQQTDPTVPSNVRSLVVGGAGYGKTSTLKKIAYDWAQGREYTRKYQLAIYLELRHIKENSLKELIENEADIVNPSMSLFELLDNMEDNVLLLLDGLDELPQKQIKDLNGLLRSKLFPKMAVVVSSRTSPKVTLSENIFWNRLIDIKGFTEERSNIFLSKYLPRTNPEQVIEKISTLLKWKNKELLSCPLFLLLLGNMEEEEQLENISNRTELFKAAFNFMVRRSLIRKNLLSPATEFDLFSFLHESKWYSFLRMIMPTQPIDREMFRLLVSFGKLAWKCLKQGRLTFEKSEILEYCETERILDLGFLMESNKTDKKRTQRQEYEPTHKTFAEFTAALYLAQRAHDEHFKEEMEMELRDLDTNTALNLVSCLLFVEEMTSRKVSLIFLIKEQLRHPDIDFYKDVLLQMSAKNEEEAMELCNEFADIMTPRASVVEDGINQFLLARLEMNQIEELECYSEFGLPLESIHVQSLVIRVIENRLETTEIPNMNDCTRITFRFHFDNNADELWEQFFEIIHHLQKNSKGEQPFPEIQLEINAAQPADVEFLSSLELVDRSTQYPFTIQYPFH